MNFLSPKAWATWLLKQTIMPKEANKGEDNQLLTNWENQIDVLVEKNKELSAKLEQLKEEGEPLSQELEEAKSRLTECEGPQNK